MSATSLQQNPRPRPALWCLAPPLIWLLTLACASDPSVHYNIETTRVTDIPASGGFPGIRVEVVADDTVVRLGDSVFTFNSHKGYLGRLTRKEGWIRIGSAEFRYDGRNVYLRTRKNWTNFLVTDDLRIYVTQDGEVGRNIFRTGSSAQDPAGKTE